MYGNVRALQINKGMQGRAVSGEELYNISKKHDNSKLYKQRMNTLSKKRTKLHRKNSTLTTLHNQNVLLQLLLTGLPHGQACIHTNYKHPRLPLKWTQLVDFSVSRLAGRRTLAHKYAEPGLQKAQWEGCLALECQPT